MSTDVAVYSGNQFSNEQLQVMKATVANGTSPAEFALFLEVCKHRKLNPFNREIYVIPGKGGKMTFQVSIDGLRLLAERSGKYQGQIGPLWCGKDGEWKEVWLENGPPAAAKVGVIRSDFKEPIFSVAKYSSYQGNSPIWQKMPDLMLAKCAESLALRRAFPDQMAGLYTHEEMAQADNDLPAQVLAQETVIEGEVTDAPAHITATPVLASAKSGQSDSLLRMIDKAQKRVDALGLDWEEVKQAALSETIADGALEMKHFAFINGKITDSERKQKAS